MKTFGAYVHARPNGQIFYVGKGTEKRAQHLRRNNHHHANITTKHGKENILVGFVPCSSEAIAFELEKGLIKCLRRNGVKLTNQTDGREGLSNPSDETRAKIGKAHRGRVHTKETREKLRAAGLGRRTTEETRAKLSKAQSNCKSTDEARAKLSKAMPGRVYVHKTGEDCRMIWPSDVAQFLSDGWSIGRGTKNGW